MMPTPPGASTETAPSSPAGDPAPNKPAAPARSLRPWGAVVLLLFVLTSAIGGSLALESSYLIVTLASHIGLALVTLGLAGYASMVVARSYRGLARASSGLASLSALAATVAGTVYLLGGQGAIALGVMEVFAVLGMIMAFLMIAFGGASDRRA